MKEVFGKEEMNGIGSNVSLDKFENEHCYKETENFLFSNSEYISPDRVGTELNINKSEVRSMDMVKDFLFNCGRNIVAVSEIVDAMPSGFQDKDFVENQLIELYNEGVVVVLNGYVEVLLPQLCDLLDSIPSCDEKSMLIEKLLGKSISAIGNKFKISSEKVIEIINNLLNTYHTYEIEEEVICRPLFEKYHYTKKGFMKEFDMDGSVYEFLNLICNPYSSLVKAA